MFKSGDRVIMTEKNPLSIYVNGFPAGKKGVIAYRGGDGCKYPHVAKLLNDSYKIIFETGNEKLVHKSEFELDKQYYREERLKKLLDDN